ncbi:hypothetical protein WQQ_13950 [Hydrocarboniphaga effusa AP103]|uniref:Uncharacterized protein n=1 Tax=Hydrocarboniphaga effusa AP103 TaxID=1172194 RepID=I8TC84_9GAMM|nr:hypothetical protein WQQ_13950 [Hydrocarboniphaga effusa AP103]
MTAHANWNSRSLSERATEPSYGSRSASPRKGGLAVAQT